MRSISTRMLLLSIAIIAIAPIGYGVWNTTYDPGTTSPLVPILVVAAIACVQFLLFRNLLTSQGTSSTTADKTVEPNANTGSTASNTINNELHPEVKDTGVMTAGALYLKTLTENGTDAVLLIDATGKVLYQNPTTERISGYRPEEIKAAAGLELIHPEDRDGDSAMYMELVSVPGKILHRRHRLLHKNGHYIWLEATYRNLLQDTGVNAIVLNYTDVSGQVTADEKIDWYNRELNLLNKINDIILRQYDERELYAEVCTCIIAHGGYKLAWICLKPEEHGKSQEVVPLVSAGETGYLGGIHISMDDPYLKKGPTATAMLTRKTIVTANIATSDAFKPWQARAREYGIAGSIVIPLKISDIETGAINIYSDSSDAFGTQEVLILERLANNLSQAVHHIRTRIEKDAATHLLQERVKELRTIYQVNRILQHEEWTRDEVFTELVNTIPQGWQYRRLCEARITFDGKHYATDGYSVSDARQTASFQLVDGRKGTIEVVYTTDMPEEHEGPFLKEERELIDSIADTIEVYFNKAYQRDELVRSEARFRGAFEYNAVGMTIASLEGKWLLVNHALCKMLGYDEEELMRRSFPALTHPGDLGKDLLYLKKLATGEIESYTIEKRYLHKNGQTVWGNLYVSVVKDSNGHPRHLVSQIENITARVLIAEQLKENEQLLLLFVEHSPAALAMFDKDMRYLQVSKRWIADYNLGDIDVIGQSHYDIFPTITQQWKNIHQHCLTGAVEKNDEDRFVRENGVVDWLKWEVRPWYRGNGEIGGLIMFTEVITERKETQLKFQNLVEKSLVGVYILQHGTFAYINPRVIDESGYSEEELLSRPMISFVYEDDRAAVYNNIEARLKGDTEEVRYELRMTKKDGSLMWIELFGTTTFYRGAPAIIGTMVNITSRKAVRDELEKSLANLRSIFETTHIGYVLADTNGQVVAVNRYFKENYFLQSGNHVDVGDNLLDVTLPEKRENLKNVLDTVRAKQVQVDYETTFTNNSVTSYFNVIVSPVISNGANIGFCMVAVDTTKRKKLELEREQIIADLVQRNNDLEQFAQIISHNVRGPLATILGLNNLLQDPRMNDEMDLLLDGINTSANQLDTVVRDMNMILQVRRALSEAKTEVKLSDLIMDIKSSLSVSIDESLASVTYDFSAAESLVTVRSYIHSICYNLIINAIKYARPDTAPAINIRSELSGSNIVLHFSDNGIGIDLDKDGHKLFQLYQRLHLSVEGKGLGLFMVKTQVEALNGKIEIDSAPGVGTTFSVILPR